MILPSLQVALQGARVLPSRERARGGFAADPPLNTTAKDVRLVLIQLISLVVDAYILMIIVRAIVSWFGVDSRQPVVAFLDRATDPILNPIRNVIGSMGPIDISPLVAILLLSLLRHAVIGLLAGGLP